MNRHLDFDFLGFGSVDNWRLHSSAYSSDTEFDFGLIFPSCLSSEIYAINMVELDVWNRIKKGDNLSTFAMQKYCRVIFIYPLADSKDATHLSPGRIRK